MKHTQVPLEASIIGIQLIQFLMEQVQEGRGEQVTDATWSVVSQSYTATALPETDPTHYTTAVCGVVHNKRGPEAYHMSPEENSKSL